MGVLTTILRELILPPAEVERRRRLYMRDPGVMGSGGGVNIVSTPNPEPGAKYGPAAGATSYAVPQGGNAATQAVAGTSGGGRNAGTGGGNVTTPQQQSSAWDGNAVSLARYAQGNAVVGGRSGVENVHPEFASRIDRMVQAMPPEIASKFGIISGHRSKERQHEVNPGVTNSHHTQGMAVDTTWDPSVRAWIGQNGAKFGVGYPLASDPKEGNHMEPLENGQRVPPQQMSQWVKTYSQPSQQQAAGSTGSPQQQTAQTGQGATWQPGEYPNAPIESKQPMSHPERNNPGNLRVAGTNDWQGKVTQPGDAFERFSSVGDGVRARAMTYASYINRGVNTIDKISNTSGPASDNNDIPSQNRAYAQALGGKYAQPGGEHLPIEFSPENIRRLTAGGISIEAGGGGKWLPQGVNMGVIDSTVAGMHQAGRFGNTPSSTQTAQNPPAKSSTPTPSNPPPSSTSASPQQIMAAVPPTAPSAALPKVSAPTPSNAQQIMATLPPTPAAASPQPTSTAPPPPQTPPAAAPDAQASAQKAIQMAAAAPTTKTESYRRPAITLLRPF